MASKTTFFKVHRNIFANEVLNQKPFDKFHAWIWLIGSANYADKDKIYKGQLQRVKRGQILTSYIKLAKEWGWSVNTVRRYIKALKQCQMVSTISTPNGTTITIENYGLYQDERHTFCATDETPGGTPGGTPDGIHNKKGKERKEGMEGSSRSSFKTAFEILDELIPDEVKQ